jgi:hypothetical protein
MLQIQTKHNMYDICPAFNLLNILWKILSMLGPNVDNIMNTGLNLKTKYLRIYKEKFHYISNQIYSTNIYQHDSNFNCLVHL